MGMAEFSVYADRAAHCTGIGHAALGEWIVGCACACQSRGLWKLASRIFVDDPASRSLCGTHGFREVRVLRQAPVDGKWRDAIFVEKLLDPAQ
jgi:L-amino acid N-acyltransferase YncA